MEEVVDIWRLGTLIFESAQLATGGWNDLQSDL